MPQKRSWTYSEVEGGEVLGGPRWASALEGKGTVPIPLVCRTLLAMPARVAYCYDSAIGCKEESLSVQTSILPTTKGKAILLQTTGLW